MIATRFSDTQRFNQIRHHTPIGGVHRTFTRGTLGTRPLQRIDYHIT